MAIFAETLKTPIMKPFLFTKLFVSGAVLICVMASISGCMQSPTSISKRVILSQTNKKMKLDAHDRSVVWIQVGKYEVSDSTERARLRELAAAGLITYNVTRYAWWEKSKTNERKAVTVTKSLYGIWTYKDTEYRTVKADNYEFCDHYVVDIALTEKGKKLLTDLPEADHIQDKEVQMDCDLEDPAEYIWNQMDLSEVWPRIENPFIEKKESTPPSNTTKSAQQGGSTTKGTQQGGAVKSAEPEKVTRIDSLQYQAYMRLDLTKYEALYFKAYDIKAAKVRNIQIYEDSGFPKCKAELILVLKNVTDAGRIYYGASEGVKFFRTVNFDYYLDKGWILEAEPLMDFISDHFSYHQLPLSTNPNYTGEFDSEWF